MRDFSCIEQRPRVEAAHENKSSDPEKAQACKLYLILFYFDSPKLRTELIVMWVFINYVQRFSTKKTCKALHSVEPKIDYYFRPCEYLLNGNEYKNNEKIKKYYSAVYFPVVRYIFH